LRTFSKYILLFLPVFHCGILFGQSDDDPESELPIQDTLIAVRNAVKVDPVQVIFGDFRIYYERLISNHYSFEVGLGFTRRNYAAGWFDYELDNLGDNVNIETGYSVSLAFRRYFQDYEELHGLYLSAAGNYRLYSKEITPIDTTGSPAGMDFRDERYTLSLIFNIGYQALPLTSNVFADFYTGPAIRFKNYDIVKTTSTNDPDAYYVENLEEVVLGWEVGIRIGFGF